MKRVLFLSGFLFFSFFVFGQDADSLAMVRVVDSLLNTEMGHWRTRNFQEALPLAQQAADISKQKWGENNRRYFTALYRLASIYTEIGQFDQAEELYLKALELRTKVLGKENPGYATYLYSLARLYDVKGDYVKAEPLYLEAKEIRAKLLGKEHADYAASLIGLGALYASKGDYTNAEPLFLEAMKIHEKTLGKGNSDYAAALNNLANVYKEKGDYGKAEPLYLEAAAIWKKTLGTEQYYAMTLGNLANLYTDEGDYAKAESLYLEAAAVWAKTLGKEHPHYANYLDDFAFLYMEKGDYAKAEPLLWEAKAIREKALGKENVDYASSLLNLANLNFHQGEYDKAEPLYVESKELYAKTLGKEDPDYAWSLNGLGNLYYAKGEYAKAEPLFLETIEIQAKSLGKEHRYYASSLNNLGNLYSDKGDYAKAEPLHVESKELLAKILGKENMSYVSSLLNLAEDYRETNRIPASSTLFLEMNALIRRLIEQSAAYSSENQMLAYLHFFDLPISQFQSFAQAHPSPEVIRAGFDNALYFNGLLLENARRLARSIAGADSLTRETYERWQGCHRRLANEYAKPNAERRYVVEVEAEAEGYEKTLTRNLPTFSEARRALHWQDVRERLRPHEVVVEFIHYRYFTPKVTDNTMYAALVLRPDWDEPKWVTLFEEKQLDSLLHGDGIAAKANKLYASRGVSPVSGKNFWSKNLYQLIWKPLVKSLNGVHTVYFSPSGRLSQLNFGAIPTGKRGETLADRYRLVQLGSTRQLVIPTERKGNNNDALLFGGIQYGMDSTAIFQANAALQTEQAVASRGELSFAYTDSTLRSGSWNYLPGTEKEITNAAQIMKTSGIRTEARKAYAATEEFFKAIGKDSPSPRILHLATHGFFFPDPAVNRQPSTVDREPVFKISDHPMIRSGLLLTGANHAWATGKPLKPGMEDGILTAYEISQMNLSNTELVVLSACETGLGDIQGNEGVYGLQRAFKIAGAKYLIMSLWQVPDKQTSLLMTTFYRKWLEEKMTIPEAFRAAQKELREAGLDPYQWAGFVLVE